MNRKRLRIHERDYRGIRIWVEKERQREGVERGIVRD